MSHILKRIEREMKHRQRTRAQVLTRRISAIVLCVAIPVILLEFGLRFFGFNRPLIGFAAQEKALRTATSALNQRFQTDAFDYDSHLFWKLKSGTNLAGLDVDGDGHLSWTRATPSTRQTAPFTILCMGDSVSAITYRTYPQIAEALASAGAGSKDFKFINAAVPGYTTEQALRMMPDLKSLQPDVIIFCFGWNDHFPALSLPDRELGASNAVFGKIHDFVKDVRIYQLLGAPLDARASHTPDKSSPEQDFRVGPGQFEENLTQLIAHAREWNALPVLSTQPDNLKNTTENFLQSNQFIAPSARDNHALHSQYNQLIRQVASSQRTPLLDLEEEFIRRPRDFMLEPDGIHLTGRGHNHVARLIFGMLKNEGLLTTGDYNTIAQAEKHDTTAPDKPRITWSIQPSAVSALPEQAFQFSVIPQNSGNTRWLRKNILPRFNLEKNISYGSSSIYARWRTLDSPTTGIQAAVPVPSDILPGEATSVTLTLKAPQRPGNYEVEIGLMADRVGPLSLYGAETTTLTVTTVTGK